MSFQNTINSLSNQCPLIVVNDHLLSPLVAESPRVSPFLPFVSQKQIDRWNLGRVYFWEGIPYSGGQFSCVVLTEVVKCLGFYLWRGDAARGVLQYRRRRNAERKALIIETLRKAYVPEDQIKIFENRIHELVYSGAAASPEKKEHFTPMRTVFKLSKKVHQLGVDLYKITPEFYLKQQKANIVRHNDALDRIVEGYRQIVEQEQRLPGLNELHRHLKSHKDTIKKALAEVDLPLRGGGSGTEQGLVIHVLSKIRIYQDRYKDKKSFTRAEPVPEPLDQKTLQGLTLSEQTKILRAMAERKHTLLNEKIAEQERRARMSNNQLRGSA